MEGEFINLFLVEKKDGGNQPAINLKHLNQFIPYQCFKMEGLHCLRNILKMRNYMCKLDLKDAYFSVLLNPASRNFVWFLCSWKFYEFLCLCFGLDPPPNILQNYPKSQFQCYVGWTYFNFLSSTTRVCIEFKEIGFDTYTGNRVFMVGSRFINHDPVYTREESLKSSEAVSRTSS